ncbi:MAG: hypothetical protein ACRCXT_07415 [Paraclostridium sp.]
MSDINEDEFLEVLDEIEPKREVKTYSKSSEGIKETKKVVSFAKKSEEDDGNEQSDAILGELHKWIRGEQNIPSKEIEKFLKSTKDKAAITNSFIVLQNMSKIQKFSKFADVAEKFIFNDKNLEVMEMKDIIYLYNLSLARIADIRGMNAQFIAEESGADDEMQRINTIIKSLDTSQIQNLLSFVKQMKDTGKGEE